MSALVTDISSEDLAELQAEQDPMQVSCPREIGPAKQGTKEIYGMGWSQVGGFPAGTHIEMLPYDPKGFPMCEVFHEIPGRFEKAKVMQPRAGEMPLSVKDIAGKLLRMEDGSIVHQVRTYHNGKGWVTTHRRLLDSPIGGDE